MIKIVIAVEFFFRDFCCQQSIDIGQAPQRKNRGFLCRPQTENFPKTKHPRPPPSTQYKRLYKFSLPRQIEIEIEM